MDPNMVYGTTYSTLSLKSGWMEYERMNSSSSCIAVASSSTILVMYEVEK